MSYIAEPIRQRLARLAEFPELLKKVLSGKGSDEDVLTVFAIIDVFRPEGISEREIAVLANALVSRGFFEELSSLLKDFDAKAVAKAIIKKALTPERGPLEELLTAVDVDALRSSDVSAVLRGSADEEILELARKYLTPRTLEDRLVVIRNVFYGTNHEAARDFLIELLKRYRDEQHKILDALIDVRPDPDRDLVSARIGAEDRKRLAVAGGRSKRILERIEDVLVEGLMLGRIGQLLHDYPELKPLGEYILEKRLRLKVPEDERRGTFVRALHFFPGIRGFEDKVVYLLADAIKYAIENEDPHLLRLAAGQLADLRVHPDIKAKVVREAIKDITESDRFFDAMDVILRNMIYDEELAVRVVRIVADVLPDIRAIIAVFGDALRRILASPAAYEVLEALIEAKPNDKALEDLIAMVSDERAKIRAGVKLGRGYEGFEPEKVLRYAYDLLEPEKLKELAKKARRSEELLGAIRRLVEYIDHSDVERILEKLRDVKASRAAPIYITLAAKFGDGRFLRPLLELEDAEIDYDSAELLVSLARGIPEAEDVVRRFIHKDSIIAAIANVYRNSSKALEYASILAERDRRAALSLLLRAFEGSNDLNAAEMVLELSENPLRDVVIVAPEAVYRGKLYEKVRRILSEVLADTFGRPGA